jgi:hypothetical protein
MNKKKIIILSLIFFNYSLVAHGENEKMKMTIPNIYKNPLYFGVTFGYGTTTWGYLVPPEGNVVVDLSLPKDVKESGEEWGMVAGYELLPTFAMEFAYDHYPRAKIMYVDNSFFEYYHNGSTSFYTNTETFSLLGKFMVLIPKNENFRAFASGGAAVVHRYDYVYNKNQLTAKFAIGGNFGLNENMMMEFGIDYTAGNAVSEDSPENHFIPFLYSVFTRLVFRL